MLEARQEAVTQAVQQALDSTHLYFAEMWRQLSESQRRILRRAATESDGAEAEELAQASGATAPHALPELRLLENRGLIESMAESGRWRFQVPMVRDWVSTRSR